MSLKYMLTSIPQLLASVLVLYYACTFRARASAYRHALVIDSCVHGALATLLQAAMLHSVAHTGLSLCCAFPSLWYARAAPVTTALLDHFSYYAMSRCTTARSTRRAVSSRTLSSVQYVCSTWRTTTCSRALRRRSRRLRLQLPWQACAWRTRCKRSTRAGAARGSLSLSSKQWQRSQRLRLRICESETASTSKRDGVR